jgi:hypothetical protein
MMQQLRAYKATRGHCLVPIRKDKTLPTYKLGLWVEQIRRQYLLLKRADESAYLSMPQMVQLVEIGFVFSARPKFISSEERIEQCHAFIAQHGHLNIPRTDPVLGQWCSTTRTSYKRNTESKHTALTPVRQQQLDALGFVWLAGGRANACRRNYMKVANRGLTGATSILSVQNRARTSLCAAAFGGRVGHVGLRTTRAVQKNDQGPEIANDARKGLITLHCWICL